MATGLFFGLPVHGHTNPTLPLVRELVRRGERIIYFSTPEFAAEVADQCRRLFGLLEDDGLRAIASLKMEGYTVDEIAAKIGRSRRSVLRRLELIRELWSADAAEGAG